MISKLHYITQEIEGKTHLQLIEEACGADVKWIQLRLKDKSDHEHIEIAGKALEICKTNGVKLIINDNVLVAKEVGADGVHLGKEDMPITEARKILGNKIIIGGTANTFEDVKALVLAGVDYVGLGPFRFTSTKKKLSPVLGLEGYDSIMQKCKEENLTIPVIAIGGIVPQDVRKILNTGIYGFAVAGYMNHAKNMKSAMNEFLVEIEQEKTV